MRDDSPNNTYNNIILFMGGGYVGTFYLPLLITGGVRPNSCMGVG